MARSIWSGVISFGLVSIPVRLYSATQEHEIAFHQFEKGTKDRIRYKRVNERTDAEVEFADIVKGAEVADGSYVLLDSDELDSVAPGRSRSLEIMTFVDLDEIDPIYFQKTYYLGPDSKETAKTYALLRDAMAATNRVAIAGFVMRGKEYLAAIRADGKHLALETMFFADEIRDPKKEIPNLPTTSTSSTKEVAMAKQLITAMSGPWKPTTFHDTYTDRVKKLIQAKEKGKEVIVTDEAPAGTNVVDLMEALSRSVEASKATKKPAKKKPAKKAG